MTVHFKLWHWNVTKNSKTADLLLKQELTFGATSLTTDLYTGSRYLCF